MNRKGFTLIELLAVIILIGIVATLIMPTAIKSLKESKEKSYEIFLENVKTAAANYYMECENGDITCTISSNEITTSITTTLGNLATLGFLKGTSTSNEDTSVLNVLDPRDNTNLNNCSIIITKTVEDTDPKADSNSITSTKVTYSVSKYDNDDNCPSSY